MKIVVAAAAAAFALAPVAASAVIVTDTNGSMTLSHLIGKASTNGFDNSVFSFAFGYNANLPAGAAWTAPSPSPVITPPPGSTLSAYKSPFANTAVENLPSSTYFSIGGTSDATGLGGVSPNTLVFGSALSAIDMLWGSIDTYNTITFLSGGAGGTVIGTFTGDDAFDLTGLPDVSGATGNYDVVGLFSFAASVGTSFDAISFSSTIPAFEFGFSEDSFVTEKVPLPFGFLLLGTALAGLGVVGRRKAA